MKRFILSIDQGTTSTRCILFDHQGQIVSSSQKEHQQYYPKPGWVEHDAVEIWENTVELIYSALAKANANGSDLAAIGITNQRESTLIWDKSTGKPLCHAVVWQDTRTDELINALARDGGLDRFRAKVGLPLSTYFSGPKVRWLLDHHEGSQQRAENSELLFGTIDSWLIWNLTGGKQNGQHLTDVTNASRTMLMNLSTLDWDADMLRQLNIPRTMLPEIRSSSEIYAECTLPELNGVPIAGVLGDQQAALFGQTCFEPGETKNTYGTGCFMLMNTGTAPIQSKHGLLTTLGYQVKGHPAVYALEGSVAIAGALVQWLRDNLKLIAKSSDIDILANTVEDSGGIYFVPAFSGLYAPYWKSDARGVIVGLTRYINSGHMARAALEATAYQTRDVLKAMNLDSGVDLKSLRVDGGMVVNQTLMQFQSDILGVEVIRPKVAETTALGAAYAAGLATGFWSSSDALKANWAVAHTWTPRMPAATREKLYAGWQKAVTRTFDWVEP
ncbi:MAG TPA: glycerol kinase GlpK [Anaerolineaceae bacterium]|nr:glycerol kinase GlpK [Anaerolineaceae bacterium]